MENKTTKEMINDCIFLAMSYIKKELEKSQFADQQFLLCQGIEHLSRAYKNINYNNVEDFNNESN